MGKQVEVVGARPREEVDDKDNEQDGDAGAVNDDIGRYADGADIIEETTHRE